MTNKPKIMNLDDMMKREGCQREKNDVISTCTVHKNEFSLFCHTAMDMYLDEVVFSNN